MADKPILFSAPMVRALLAGTKTQTRRVLKPQPDCHNHMGHSAFMASFKALHVRYAPGDRMWVKERLERANGEAVGYPADGSWLPNTPWLWQRAGLPSIHMPRRLSRLTLLVTDVRVERLQDISQADAIAEGLDWVAPTYGIGGIAASWNSDPRQSYAALWDSINGPGAWEENPWVVALTFDVRMGNIDAKEDGND